MGLPAPGTEMARLTSAQVDIWLIQLERERLAKRQVVRPLDPAILGSASNRSALYRTIFGDVPDHVATVAPIYSDQTSTRIRHSGNLRNEARHMRITQGNPRTPPASSIPLDNARLLRAIAVVRRDPNVVDDDFTSAIRGVTRGLEQMFMETPDMPRSLVDLDMSRLARQIQHPMFPTSAHERAGPENVPLGRNGHRAPPLESLGETRLRFRVHLLDAIRQNYDHVLNHGPRIMDPRNPDILPPMMAYMGWRFPLPDPEILDNPLGSYLEEYERAPNTNSTNAGSDTASVESAAGNGATMANIPQDLSLFFPPPRLLGFLLTAFHKFEHTPLHSRIRSVTAKPITTQTWCYILSDACKDHPQLETFVQVFVALNPEIARTIIARTEGPHARTFVYGEHDSFGNTLPREDGDQTFRRREPNPDNLQVLLRYNTVFDPTPVTREVYIP